jgi:transposase-like protein
MALSQSALLEVLDALKASDSSDVIRTALQVILQQLIDAEATAFIGAEPHERTENRLAQRNGARSRRSPQRRVMWTCRSPSCGRGRSSPRCSNAADASTRRCSR